MEYLDLPSAAVPHVNHNAVSLMKQFAMFIALAFGISWLTWISALRLGAGPGRGEEILAFGASGPAVAAIFLSRRGPRGISVRLPVRLLWFAALWSLAWAIYVAHDKMRGTKSPFHLYYLIVALLAMIPAWIASGAFTRDTGVRELLQSLVYPRNWRWQAIAFFFFPAILLVPAAIVHLLGGTLVWPESRGTFGSYAFHGAIFFLNNFLFTAVLEEPGWRGYLLPYLQRRTSPLLASLLVWLPWALWHAPLDFSGGVGRSLMYYFRVRAIFLIPITIIMTWIYNRSGGNILSTAIFHAGMNTFPFVLPYFPQALGLIFVLAGYAVFADKMWRRQNERK